MAIMSQVPVCSRAWGCVIMSSSLHAKVCVGATPRHPCVGPVHSSGFFLWCSPMHFGVPGV
eukprot:6377959-Alexandrium_andersonii.AAC.1